MSRTRSRLLLLPATVAVLALLAACSDDPGTAAAEAAPSQAPQAAGAQRGPGGGVTGEIAAVSDALMQVQGDDGQTAVAWDDGTAITQTVAASLSDVTAGVCVVAVSASGTAGDDTAATATSVAVSAATDGECGGFPGGAGGGQQPGDGFDRPEGAPTDMPDGAPTDRPDGAPTDLPDDARTGGMGGGLGGMTAGLVTAVAGDTITVESARPDDDETNTATITVDDATTYTTDADADATAITVGRCVSAQGEADDSGQVAATSLRLSDPGDDGCTQVMAGRGSFGGGLQAPGGTDGSDDA